MSEAFWLQETKGSVKLFLHTRPMNFWLCLPIFDVYGRKAVQGASREITQFIFVFLAKIPAYVS